MNHEPRETNLETLAPLKLKTCDFSSLSDTEKPVNQWLTSLVVAEAGFEPTTFGL